MSVETAEPASTSPSAPTPAGKPTLVVIALVLGALALIAGAYALGLRSGRHTATAILTGNAYVGDHQASVRVDGWEYGIAGDVPWFDTHGTLHDSGWPGCFNPPGRSVRIRFGAVPAAVPGGSRYRAVVWVDCRG